MTNFISKDEAHRQGSVGNYDYFQVRLCVYSHVELRGQLFFCELAKQTIFVPGIHPNAANHPHEIRES